MNRPNTNSKRILYILRGLPGSGKTTLAHRLVNQKYVFENDDYFTDENGQYHYDASKMPIAIRYCQERVENAMKSNIDAIAVANTHIRHKEFKFYHELAKQYQYDVIEIIVKSSFKNVHHVPDATLHNMKNNFEF